MSNQETLVLAAILLLIAPLCGSAWSQQQTTPEAGLPAAPVSKPADQYDFSREDSFSTSHKSSSYVPLDSWIYPAIDRLEALGYLPTSTVSVRPLTRLECARLLAEAHSNFDGEDESAGTLIAVLDDEFIYETSVIDGGKSTQAIAESIYARLTGIAGTPLRDDFHFAQTLDDDNGRPYGQGGNSIVGFSGRAHAGMFSVYMRGEYQYASAIPAYSAAAQKAIVQFDVTNGGWNLPPGTPPPVLDISSGTANRVRFVEVYASLNLSNWQISFGQQNLWWGPDRSTSLIFSNNAAALPMLRFARVKPISPPGFLSWLGPVRFDLFFAREGGIHYVGLGSYTSGATTGSYALYGNAIQPLNPPPYMWGVTLSLKPTENFEIGFGHTTIFAGYGRPLTVATFLHSFSIYGNGQELDPGKRVSEFNLYYHLPGFRKSIVVYTEGMAWDDPIQGSFLGRYAMDPGIYLPHLPGLKKLDLRMEGVYTDLPGLKYTAYFYGNPRYVQGYTNYGQILGSWIGRQGRGGQASSTYWFSPRIKAAVSYRRMTVDKAVLQGGSLDDLSGNFIYTARKNIELSATGQYERWKFPQLASGPQQNFTATFQIKIFPKEAIGSK